MTYSSALKIASYRTKDFRANGLKKNLEVQSSPSLRFHLQMARKRLYGAYTFQGSTKGDVK